MSEEKERIHLSGLPVPSPSQLPHHAAPEVSQVEDPEDDTSETESEHPDNE